MSTLEEVIDVFSEALRELHEREGSVAALRVAATTIAFYYSSASCGMLRRAAPVLVEIKEENTLQ